MKRNVLFDLLQRFFTEHLAAQRNLSAHTITAYRDGFRLLLTFLSTHRQEPIDRLTLESLSPEFILGFLDHLERTRGNGVRTRNVRLAAIRAFARFAVGEATPRPFPPRSPPPRNSAETRAEASHGIHDQGGD